MGPCCRFCSTGRKLPDHVLIAITRCEKFANASGAGKFLLNSGGSVVTNGKSRRRWAWPTQLSAYSTMCGPRPYRLEFQRSSPSTRFKLSSTAS